MQKNLLNFLAQSLSYLLHPLYFFMLMLYLFHSIHAVGFAYLDAHAMGLIYIQSFIYTVMLPAISILLMQRLGLIGKIDMPLRMDRIGPYIATAIFYSWYYIQIRADMLYPQLMKDVLLGVILSLYLGFFINNFYKISIHAIATGGFIAFAYALNLCFHNGSSSIGFRGLGINGNALTILYLSLCIMTVVGWARLYLHKHSPNQWISGVVIGIAGMGIAFLM